MAEVEVAAEAVVAKAWVAVVVFQVLGVSVVGMVVVVEEFGVSVVVEEFGVSEELGVEDNEAFEGTSLLLLLPDIILLALPLDIILLVFLLLLAPLDIIRLLGILLLLGIIPLEVEHPTVGFVFLEFSIPRLEHPKSVEVFGHGCLHSTYLGTKTFRLNRYKRLYFRRPSLERWME